MNNKFKLALRTIVFVAAYYGSFVYIDFLWSSFSESLYDTSNKFLKFIEWPYILVIFFVLSTTIYIFLIFPLLLYPISISIQHDINSEELAYLRRVRNAMYYVGLALIAFGFWYLFLHSPLCYVVIPDYCPGPELLYADNFEG